MIRARQRGRYGVPALDRVNVPVPSEMAFDKIMLSVAGRLQNEVQPGAPASSALLNSYRALLSDRAENSRGTWTIPSVASTHYHTTFSSQSSTIGSSNLKATWADDVHHLRLNITANPTRTLLHLSDGLRSDGYVGATLHMMSNTDFFASSGSLTPARTLDHNDNAFDNLDEVRRRMGDDHADNFIGLFERQLKKWALEAIAPASLGFVPDRQGVLTATDGVHRVTLDWRNLFVGYAEIYCERRHSNAPALMNRLSGKVTASHAEGQWQQYPIEQTGGRSGGSATIGVKPTANIWQKFYAKTLTRVRIETQYTRRVKNTLRTLATSMDLPLSDVLLGLRNDAVHRLQRDAFLTMCEEPATPLVSDFARLVGSVARCCARAKVDPEYVFEHLIGSGGIDEGVGFPRRLAKLLAAEGVIEHANLLRRARPGQRRRHHLTPGHHASALQIQSVFGSGTP